MTYRTPQEAFWAGDFGNEYIDRNGEKSLPQRTRMLARMLDRTSDIGSIIEYGANIGLNLRALRQLIPDAEFWAVEINKRACDLMRKEAWIHVQNNSLLDFRPERTLDLVLIQGVLIHINPANLGAVYEVLYRSSSNYICISEYYNPTPVEVLYRGHAERLYKRDFAGEVMTAHPDLELIDYGFAYHRDKRYLADDLTWFLLKKQRPRIGVETM
jgi:spore coat polysaccharide biosynthesis protein SpsF